MLKLIRLTAVHRKNTRGPRPTPLKAQCLGKYVHLEDNVNFI